ERKLGLVAADEFVFGERVRMAVQERLPHRELVQIGFKQTAYNWNHDHFPALASNSCSTSPDCARRAPRCCRRCVKSSAAPSKPSTALMQSVISTSLAGSICSA